jgi:hypothetical protein
VYLSNCEETQRELSEVKDQLAKTIESRDQIKAELDKALNLQQELVSSIATIQELLERKEIDELESTITTTLSRIKSANITKEKEPKKTTFPRTFLYSFIIDSISDNAQF